MEVDTPISGFRVQRVLEAVVRERGRPDGLVVDNGARVPLSCAGTWSVRRRVPLQFNEPGAPDAERIRKRVSMADFGMTF